MKNFFKQYLYLTIFITVALIVLAWFLLIAEGEYGITLFFTIPLSIGLIKGYITSFEKAGMKKLLKSLFQILIGISALTIVLIIGGLEGAICIFMAIPFILLALVIGYTIGAILGILDEKRYMGSVLIFMLLINPASYIFDTYTEPIRETITTEKMVNTSSDRIWRLLDNQIVFAQQDFILFQKGVSYPQSIKMINNNGKRIYRCQTNNDQLNLIIDEYIEHRKVKFSLENQTIPMKEISPYEEIDAKHLHDYFTVKYGEITLEKLSDNTTKMIAKTEYSYRIAPAWYWKKWSGFILNTMQDQVLKSIKKQAENERFTTVL